MPPVRRKSLLIVYAAFFVTLSAFYFLEYPIPGLWSVAWNVLLASGLMVLLAGLGRRLLQWTVPREFADAGGNAERWLLSVGAGAVPFSMALLGLGVTGPFNPGAIFFLTVGAAVVAGPALAAGGREATSEGGAAPAGGVGFLALGVFALAFLCAMAPPTYYDSLVYHLALPAKYLQEGRVGFVPYNHYSHFPQNTEMIFGWFLALGTDVAAQFWNVGLAALTGWGLWRWGRSAFLQKNTRFDMVLFLTAPCVVLLSSETYVEVPMAFWTCLAVWSASKGVESSRRGWWGLAGLFGGYAAGIKYTGVLTPGLLFLGALLWPRARGWAERWKDAGALGAVAFAVFLPWMVKNAVLTGGNPVFPFLPSIFPASKVFMFKESSKAYFAVLDEYKGTSGLLITLFKMPFQLATNATRFGGGFDVTGDLGWALPLLLLPLGFLGLRRNGGSGGFLLAYATAHVLLWACLRPVLRFLFPVFPLICLLAGRGLNAVVVERGAAFRRVVAAGLGLFVLSNAVLFYWVERVRDPFPVAFGLVDREAYLNQKLDYYPWTQRMSTLPPASRVLFVGDQRGYYCPRPYLAPMALLPPPLREWSDAAADADALRRRLIDLGFTHLFFNRREAERLKSYRVLDLTPHGASVFEAMLKGLTVLASTPQAALFDLGAP